MSTAPLLTDRTLVVIPTYNERDTLPKTMRRLRAAVPWAHALVVDDGSPDGTGALADQLAAADPMVHVLHRTEKAGLGPAYVAGFRWGLACEVSVLVEMDADGSHRPEQLPRLLTALEADPQTDLVIGSRWVRGGAVHNWPVHREALSRGANLYVRAALAMPVHDATAGFRAYRADLVRTLLREEIASQGYCFQVDMTRLSVSRGARVREVPIDFDERIAGASKMGGSIIREALLRVTGWGIAHWTQRALGAARYPGATIRRLPARKGER